METSESSALYPAAVEAAQIAALWWWMCGGALVVWSFMIGLSYYAIYGRSRTRWRKQTAWLIIGGGVVFPSLVLLVLLCLGLSLLARLLEPVPDNALTIEVHGAQYWWRVRYPQRTMGTHTLAAFETANEIVLPVDQPVRILLRSEDVIHAFWVPALGGKIDAIPGRTTRLVLHPFRTGVYRGICAEYCGASHAFMNFETRVVQPEQFERWSIDQQRPFSLAADSQASRGYEVFLRSGCGACHTLRTSKANGVVGPDLTHFASRSHLAAGRLVRTSESTRRWLTSPEQIKPEAEMPPFDSLSPAELDDLVAFLDGLQ